MLRAILQLTRAHSAPLEIIPAYAGAVLATGRPFGEEALIWAGLGLLYHLAGYGMNGYSDWKNGYDKNDPYKSHHPLNTGVMKPSTAITIVTVVTSILVVGIVYAASRDAFAILALGIIGGVAYNFYGKETYSKPILIATAHTSMFLMPYITYSNGINKVGMVVGSSIFIWVVYQIAISGEILALGSEEEETIIEKLGGSLQKVPSPQPHQSSPNTEFQGSVPYFEPPKWYPFVGLVMRMYVTLFLFLAAHLQEAYASSAAVVVFGVVAIWLDKKLQKEGWFSRSDAMTKIVAIEALNLFMLLAVIAPHTGYITAAIMMVGCLVWVFLGNYIEWGTVTNPQV